MKDLLYALPDTKTRNTIGDKIENVFPNHMQPAAQTLGVKGVNY